MKFVNTLKTLLVAINQASAFSEQFRKLESTLCPLVCGLDGCRFFQEYDHSPFLFASLSSRDLGMREGRALRFSSQGPANILVPGYKEWAQERTWERSVVGDRSFIWIFGGIVRYVWLNFTFTLSLRRIFAHLARSTVKLNRCVLDGSKWIMSGESKNCKTSRVEEKENSTQQDQSTETSKRVSERRRRKYYPREAKKLEEEICETKHSCIWEEEAKKHKESFPQFKRRMIKFFGETFFYKGGSWHGEESRRYRHYHIRKAMRFLQENMNEE